MDEKIFEERLKEIVSTNRAIIQNNLLDTEISRNTVSRSALSISRRISAKIREELEVSETISDEKLFEIVEKITRSWWISTENEKMKFICIRCIDGMCY